MKNPYKVLKVKKTATAAEIKKAYRKRSTETHPDKGGSSEAFNEVAEAYNVLKDPVKRKLFDEKGIVEEAKIEQNFYNDVVELFFNVITTKPNVIELEADIIAEITYIIDDKIETSKKHIKGLTGNITELKKFKGKIIRKDTENEAENMFENLIDGKIHNDEKEIQSWKDDIEKQNKIKEIVNQYECKTTKTNNKQTNVPF